jgi:outer membrane protein, heavy metal efflux system
MHILNSLRKTGRRAGAAVLLVSCGLPLAAQQTLTWDQVKAKFETSSPVLRADADNVDEMRAEEITAYLRPNPQVGLTVDGNQILPHSGIMQPFRGTFEVPSIS